jgi:hypothetical protein
MDEKTGVARMRQAITNQATCGSGQFELSIDSADKLCREVEDELARVSWAEGVPAPVDADGEAVPLTTKVMYTNRGKKIELSEFHLLHSVLSGGFVWRATRDTDHGVEDLKLDFLHLRRPDSWGKLEEDVQRVKETGDICGYYDKVDKPCDECPALNIPSMCSATMLRDVLRRAKALAERDARGSTPQTSPHGAKEAAE